MRGRCAVILLGLRTLARLVLFLLAIGLLAGLLLSCGPLGGSTPTPTVPSVPSEQRPSPAQGSGPSSLSA